METCYVLVRADTDLHHAAETWYVGPHLVPTVTIPPSIHAFWSAFTSTIGQDPSDRFYEAFHFDDDAPVADELAALVLAGKKRATAALAWAYEAEGKPSPSQVISASSRCSLVNLCASSRPWASDRAVLQGRR